LKRRFQPALPRLAQLQVAGDAPQFRFLDWISPLLQNEAPSFVHFARDEIQQMNLPSRQALAILRD
jgi:hypothetical protein